MKKNEGAGALLCVRGGEPTRHPSIHLLTAVLLTPDQGRGAAADRPSNPWVKGSCSTSGTTSSDKFSFSSLPIGSDHLGLILLPPEPVGTCDPVAGSSLSLPLTVADGC